MTRLNAPRQLSDNLYLLYAEHPHRDSSNVYLVTGTQPVLIDCGSRRSVPHMLRNLAQLGMTAGDITAVLATHGDCDHTQGFHDLQRENQALRLHLHPAHWPLVQEPNPYRNAAYLYRIAFLPIPSEACMPLTAGQRIVAGDGELVVLHTPGHTEGSGCLWGEIDGRHVLFAGDTVGGSMRSLEGANLAIWAAAAATWQTSLRRIAPLKIDWILNGHEPEPGLPLSRAWLDRGMSSFGLMMNPWFFLHEVSDENEATMPEPATEKA